MIRGGQGRSDKETREEGATLLVVLALFVLLLILVTLFY